jgi:transcriptional regulator with XRE-family HTH domain
LLSRIFHNQGVSDDVARAKNAIRRLRRALSMSQTQFAVEAGLSIASIQNYERGSQPSDEAIHKMQTLAAEHGLEEIAFSLRAKPFSIQKVFAPGGKHVRVPNAHGSELGHVLHEKIDIILAKGDGETVALLEGLVNLVAGFVEGKNGR